MRGRRGESSHRHLYYPPRHPVGNPNGAQKSVPKKPEETRELALGGAEKQDVQRQSGGGRRSEVGGKQRANSQEPEKDWEGVDTRPAAGAKATIKPRPAQNFRAGAGSARERLVSQPGGGSGLGEGSRKLSGYWGSHPRLRLRYSPLRESLSAALCP